MKTHSQLTVWGLLGLVGGLWAGWFSSTIQVRQRPPLFSTKVRMYYINLESSAARRVYMDEAFGTCGKLIRVPAIDGNEENLELMIGGQDLASRNMTFTQYLNSARVRHNELALTMSHIKAIKQIYEDEVSEAIVFEDDVSPILSPFWKFSVDEVVNALYSKDPHWELLRMQFSIAQGNHREKAMTEWRGNPQQMFCSKRYFAYGTVAYLISRAGAKKLLDRLTDADGKFDCLKSKSKQPCASDYILFKELDNVYLRSPPMFVSRVMEDDTGVRSRKEKKLSDQWKLHYRLMLESLQWGVEEFENSLAQTAAKRSNSSSPVFQLTDVPLLKWTMDIVS